MKTYKDELIKSMNYLGNMLAKKAAHNEGYFEPVFFNKDKEYIPTRLYLFDNHILILPLNNLN